MNIALQFYPIEADAGKNRSFTGNPECREILAVYPSFYERVGFHPPWIGYFFQRGDDLVGCGGFKGKPKEGTVEISYGTFEKFQRQGVGTEICRQLVLLSQKTDPSLRVTARTLMENNASASILKHNGFECAGVVHDDEDGNVWEWEYKRV